MDSLKVASFAKLLKGEAVLPKDPEYAQLRQVGNPAVNRFPAIIARCTNPQDGKKALGCARAQGFAVAIWSGNHSFAGHGTCDDGLLVDLSLMKRVEIDPRRG